MIILGINAFHADSSACLVVDGELLAAAEEERFRRVKHWAGFPSEAIRYCLAAGGVDVAGLDHVAINRNPKANLLKKVLFGLSKRPNIEAITDRLRNAAKVRGIDELLCSHLGVPRERLRARLHKIEHHRAHMASAFLVSPFHSAATVSVDGFGDFVSAMWGEGEGSTITARGQVDFPHSLGLFYLAATQYLGFPNYGDEYKVMGLAPYGEPTELEKVRDMVHLVSEGRFELNLDYFRHHTEGVEMVWDDGEPRIGPVYTERLEELLGPARHPDDPLEQRHRNIAASLQAMYEEAFFHLLDHVHERTGHANLCLAGGCAMNSVANGKVFERSRFTELYVQPAAGDAGGAIGAAYAVWNQELGNPRGYHMDHAFLGPEFDAKALHRELAAHETELETERCQVDEIEDRDELCRRTAERIAEGKVVGWFQGRMEWGPRALGNRSILADPRRADMKDILNLKVKRRESFRPFAPSILREAVAEWFETDYDVPFMLKVYQIREKRRAEIPAVTHVNGSGRLQTVSQEQNPLYHRLIAAFGEITGVPLLLNTSFNENEPVVCRPDEALKCFLRTKMDVLVLGNHFIERPEARPPHRPAAQERPDLVDSPS